MIPRSKNYLRILTVGLLLIALVIFLLFDLMAVVSVYLSLTLTYAAFWLVLGAILLRRQSKLSQLLTLSLFLAAILATYAINWDSRKAFLKDLYDIEPGMTMAEVDRRMVGYFRTPAAPGQMSSEKYVTYRHTNEGWGDSDWGMVTFQEGRVHQVEFLPD